TIWSAQRVSSILDCLLKRNCKLFFNVGNKQENHTVKGMLDWSYICNHISAAIGGWLSTIRSTNIRSAYKSIMERNRIGLSIS
ncbi:hypothetical protein GJ496_009167, partial [Pomphorhynchus laevis]